MPYSGRTSHIHVLVRHDGHPRLVTQVFIEGEPGNAGDFLYRGLGADARLVTMKLADAPAGSGAKLAGSIDLVIA